ncbi:MAG: PEP-CTERM sorting domain-containing protein [Pseudomonadota bacterium]
MRLRKLMNLSVIQASAIAAMSLLASPAAHAATFFGFSWEGQVAGFGVEGTFSYDEENVPTDGVIRRDDLLTFDVSFYDPLGNLMRTYVDNHLTYDGFNFNFDTATNTILQDGAFSAPDGIDIGEYTQIAEGEFTGLNFWSRPSGSSVPHVHFDDWSNEFGFPRAFGGHEDVAFFGFTTQQLVDSNGIGPDYADNPNFPLDALGARMVVAPVPLPATLPLLAGVLGLGLLGARRLNRKTA